MTRIAQTIRGIGRQATQYTGIITDISADGRASVRLSRLGATFKMLPIVGGPVTKGQNVLVDFTTPTPTIVAPGVDTVFHLPQEGITRKVKPSTKATVIPNLINVYSSPATNYVRPAVAPLATFPVTEQGLNDAIDFAQSGYAIYLPPCSIPGIIVLPKEYETQGFKSDIYLIGDSQTTSILTGNLTVGGNSHIANLTIKSATVNGSYIVACILLGDCDFTDVIFDAYGASQYNPTCVTHVFESHATFNNCTFISTHDGINSINGINTQCSSHSVMTTGVWQYNPGTTISGSWPSAITFAELTKDPGHGYYLRDAMQVACFGDARTLPTGSSFWIECGVTSGENITTAHFQVTHFTGYFSGIPQEVTDNPDHVIPSSETSYVEYVEGIPIADVQATLGRNYLYGPGDTIAWKFDDISEGWNHDFPNYIFFSLGRYINDDRSGAEFTISIERIYIKFPDGTRVNLLPYRGYFYFNNCNKWACANMDIDLDAGSIMILSNTSATKITGDEMFTYSGDKPVFASQIAPLATYPGMFWLKE